MAFKKDEWAREQLSIMAFNEITSTDLARELGISKGYLSQIFLGRTLYDGSRGGDGARGGISRDKVEKTLSRMIARKQKGA